MKLTGNFYLENEKITFLFVVLDFGKKNIYLQYKNKIYDYFFEDRNKNAVEYNI